MFLLEQDGELYRKSPNHAHLFLQQLEEKLKIILNNKDENVHRFALSSIRELLERERERER